MIKSKRILTALVAAMILAGLAFFGLGRILVPAQASSQSGGLPESAAQVPTAAPQISAEGQVVPAQHASLAFQTGGLVQAILVAEGQTVSAGTPLLRLASSDQEIALRQAEAVQGGAGGGPVRRGRAGHLVGRSTAGRAGPG